MLISELFALGIMGLILLVKFVLVRLLHLLESLYLLSQLFVKCLTLLRKERDLVVSGGHSLLQLISELLDLVVQVALYILCFLLLEQDLILVIHLCVSKSLLSLVLYISDPLLKTHLLSLVELLQICQLLLRVCVNLIYGILQLSLFVFQCIFQLFYSVVESSRVLFHQAFVVF